MKKIITLICTLLAGTALFAQVSVDPQDDFYTDAQNWEIKGIVKNLPPLRPYTLNNIKGILTQVLEKGSEDDIETAECYMEEIFGKSWRIELEAAVKGKISKKEETSFTKNILGYPALKGNMSFFNDIASIGYKLGLAATKNSEMDFLPEYTYSEHDAYFDDSVMGPFVVRFDGDVTTSVGNENLFAQLGINRSSFGSNLSNGLAIDDSDYHSGNLGFTYMGNKWNYVQQFSVIGASRNNGSSRLNPNKFFSFHAAEVYPTDNFHFSYYESIIFGNRFDPAYFIPAPYMATQGLGGYSDNLLMGINFDWKIMKGLLWYSDVFVDDLSVNELVKFNFNTRIRLAAQTGVIYVPELKYINRITLDFTAILPYMYSHAEHSLGTYNSINYQNYTNAGFHIGSEYDPNSAIVALNIKITPLKGLKINAGGTFIVHGNVAENVTENEAKNYLETAGYSSSDGSVYNHTENPATSGLISNSELWSWLTQEHLMYTVQGNISCEYELQRFKWGKVSIEISSVTEYIKNKGVDSNIYTSSYTTIEEAKAAWIANLHDEINEYISIGLKYNF